MIISIQSMRAIAAILVVFHHVAIKGRQYGTDPMHWFNVGGAGVDLFFIISGYVMCQTTFNRNVNIARFMQARFVRIMPLYWVLTSAALLVYIIMPEKVNSSGGVTSIFHSYTLLPSSSKYLIQNGWTLSYEFYFYVIFSFGLFFPGGLKHLFPSLAMISLVLVGFYVDAEDVYTSFLTSPLLLEFVFGIALFNFYKRVQFNSGVSFLLLPVSVALLSYVNLTGGFDVRIMDYGVPCLLFFVAMLNFEPVFLSLREHWLSRTAEYLGDSSYSLYLLHPFVLVVCSIVMVKLGLTDNSYVFVFVLLFSSVLAGCCCYALLEKPLIKLMKSRIGTGRKVNDQLQRAQ